MIKMIFSKILIMVLFSACTTFTTNHQSILNQGIAGRVTIETGNHFPSPIRMDPAEKGLFTAVYVFEQTNISETEIKGAAPFFKMVKSKLITRLHTDSLGNFKVALPIGSYSLFIRKGDAYYANRFDQHNNINLITVKKGKVTDVTITESSEAAF